MLHDSTVRGTSAPDGHRPGAARAVLKLSCGRTGGAALPLVRRALRFDDTDLPPAGLRDGTVGNHSFIPETPSMEDVTVVDHPLVRHKLSHLRKKDTDSARFRLLLREISLLLGYEVTRDLNTEDRIIETPLAEMSAPFLSGKEIILISILRAGNGLLEGMLDLVPSAQVGHVGLYRDPETLQAVEYYFKVPVDLGNRPVILLDPMLATGNSAVAAVERIKAAGARQIKFLCLLSAPEGIEAFHAAHPDVPVFTAAIDERLNDHGYIVPGIGDAGDRIYGTQ